MGSNGIYRNNCTSGSTPIPVELELRTITKHGRGRKMIQKLIDANELKREMCRKCIDTDEETEKGRAKWDSGLWIRYKVFEDAVILAPRVDAVEVVRCKDCKRYWKNKPSEDVPVCLASPKDDAFCSEGKRREDG